MVKVLEPPKEPASKVAERKWRNHDVTKRFLEARQRRPKLVEDREPEIAETITNDGRVDGPIKRAETKFAREIRAMMQSHVDKNLAMYVAQLDHRKRILLKEKLRRLKAAHPELEEASQ
jgi:hypothetical protein